MSRNKIAEGVVHKVPDDLKESLLSDHDVLALWDSITPLARNEWICWIQDAKREETRKKRIERLSHDLQKGKRRPCCWPGCSHRK